MVTRPAPSSDSLRPAIFSVPVRSPVMGMSAKSRNAAMSATGKFVAALSRSNATLPSPGSQLMVPLSASVASLRRTVSPANVARPCSGVPATTIRPVARPGPIFRSSPTASIARCAG
jgi:hypothetical protein